MELLSEDDITLSLFAGVWSSLHDNATGSTTSDSFVENWYEADWYGELNLTVGAWSFGLAYILYTSPNDAFGTVDELDLSMSFDDSEIMGDWALSPSATIAFETGSNAADGGDEGVYLELGIAPGFTIEESLFDGISISIPATVGLSLSDYYEDAAGNDDTFGYFDVGVEASVNLPIPDEYGAWTLTAGVHALFLGDNLETINGGTDTEVIATVGLSFDY